MPYGSYNPGGEPFRCLKQLVSIVKKTGSNVMDGSARLFNNSWVEEKSSHRPAWAEIGVAAQALRK
jgi:hypothetical protein